MTSNRSVPTSVMLAQLSYADVGAASDWLCSSFGSTEHYRYGDPENPQGAQLLLNDACVMLSGGGNGGKGTVLTIFVSDVDEHFAHSVAAGAEIVDDVRVSMYGERQYVAKDFSGRVWMFSVHERDVDPGDWATVNQSS